MVLEIKKPRPMWEILFSTHHTDIGLLYIITSMAFLFMGGALALTIRSELFLPGAHFMGMGQMILNASSPSMGPTCYFFGSFLLEQE
jgi:heme/copper-type cytochrome/quinol oxidase subunit 1